MESIKVGYLVSPIKSAKGHKCQKIKYGGEKDHRFKFLE